MTGTQLPNPADIPGTRSAPDEEKGSDADTDPELATWLVWCETRQLFRLPRSARAISVGSDPDSQICIPSRYVSANHGRLVRTRSRWSTRDVWTMRDNRSKNGTFLRGERLASFPVTPGTTFLLGARANQLLALDNEMHRRYPELVDILGDQGEHSVDPDSEQPSPCDVILAARNNANMAIISEPHCEQTRLARVIHAVSYLRGRELVERHRDQLPTDGEGRKALKLLAERSTIVIDLGADDRPLDQPMLTMLFKGRNRIRVIVLAENELVAFSALRGRFFPSQRIELRPLAERPQAIPRLLDRILEEQGSSLRTMHLTATNREALQVARWAENFKNLREVAKWLAAIVEHGSPLKAAVALGYKPPTFYAWLKDWGLSKPFAPHFDV